MHVKYRIVILPTESFLVFALNVPYLSFLDYLAEEVEVDKYLERPPDDM
jgi:hypothetical protein